MTNFRQTRVDRGYTQQELAEYLGVGQSSVAKWELGRVRTPDHVLEVMRTLPTHVAHAARRRHGPRRQHARPDLEVALRLLVRAVRRNVVMTSADGALATAVANAERLLGA